MVGIGGTICDTTTTGSSNTVPAATYTATLGLRDRLNPYFAELIAISTALRNLASLPLRGRVITVLSSNLAALHAINCPKQQLGQSLIQQIYKATSKLKADGNQVFAM
jgi:hypothetical protein